ncbi:uncharacterized protein LOC128265533 [Drosophila gunungcola]|uniref:uncharacterized protein LOC128265533 n=1 Tax=Drosophila gunungcola TaxID=103775 RepID=UPI0022E8B8C1|nr:uncharacterized protein LOC128265533 [Drosophila gunungcola]
MSSKKTVASTEPKQRTFVKLLFNMSTESKLTEMLVEKSPNKPNKKEIILRLVPISLSTINLRLNRLLLKVTNYVEDDKRRSAMPLRSLMPSHLKWKKPNAISTLIRSRQTPKLDLKDVRRVIKGRVAHRACKECVAIIYHDMEYFK